MAKRAKLSRKAPATAAEPVATRTRVIGYIRVSTAQQVDHGSSLEAQREKLVQYAALAGLELVDTAIDAGLSAACLSERPALNEALDRIMADEADGLLVVKLDRLTRNVRDLCDLVDNVFRHKRLISVHENIDTTTASGRLVLNILVTVSQWEREAAAERTQAVMSHLKATGKYTGGFPPFGWKVDEEGALVEEPIEQKTIAHVRWRRDFGHSIREIARTVYNPRTAKLFNATQIARML